MNPILQTLGTSGQRIYVEVKARMGWASMRHENDTDGLLLSCAKKAAACSDGILLSIVIAMPARSDEPGRTPHILIADPNSPPPLSVEEQAAFFLERYLFQANRYGLELLRLHILRWQASLQESLGPTQQEELVRLDKKYPANAVKQPFLPSRDIGGRPFQGRYFYTLIERLGAPGRRHLTLDEAIAAATQDGDLGTKYFAGVDTELQAIIARQDLRGLLTFGVRGEGSVDLSGKSAFREEPVELDDADRAQIKLVVGNAVEMWKKTKIW